MIQRLQILLPEHVLGPAWFQQHALIEKLNMQAHASAKSGHDEFVVDGLNREGKAIVLLQNLLLIEYVKHKLFPKLMKAFTDAPTSLRASTFITNESTVLNFLEILTFHRSTIDEMGENIGELVD